MMRKILRRQVQPRRAQRLIVVIGAVDGEVIGARAPAVHRETRSGPPVLIVDRARLQQRQAGETVQAGKFQDGDLLDTLADLALRGLDQWSLRGDIHHGLAGSGFERDVDGEIDRHLDRDRLARLRLEARRGVSHRILADAQGPDTVDAGFIRLRVARNAGFQVDH